MTMTRGVVSGIVRPMHTRAIRRRHRIGAALAALAWAVAAPVPARGDGTSTTPSKAAKKQKPPPLDGQSYEYEYDGADKKRPELAWYARAFVHKKAAVAKGPLPLLVFIHGLNREQIKYRWMGGGNEGDVRRIVAELV